MQKKFDICYTSFPHHFSKKKFLLVDLSARRVYPLLMFALRCNFTTCNFGNFVKFSAELFLRINLSSYFQASHFSGILRISGITDLQHWIFFNFSDILLMLLEESGVSFPFPESKKLHGGKSILMNFFKSFEKKSSKSSTFH